MIEFAKKIPDKLIHHQWSERMIICGQNLDPAANNHFLDNKIGQSQWLSFASRKIPSREEAPDASLDSKSSSLPLAEWESRDPTRILITDLRGSTAVRGGDPGLEKAAQNPAQMPRMRFERGKSYQKYLEFGIATLSCSVPRRP